MADWQTIAQALALGIPEADLSRTVEPLAGLEPVFQRLAASVAPSDEPAVVFDPGTEDVAQ